MYNRFDAKFRGDIPSLAEVARNIFARHLVYEIGIHYEDFKIKRRSRLALSASTKSFRARRGEDNTTYMLLFRPTRGSTSFFLVLS